ncbi:hypothetical protein LCGC14_0437470 [marine sediment metagenome]|uniref:Uncharacterized protein n=1 Tax=marine sediment metagenome TaxID=412755 RepID=A0A0F9V8E9_9ZZZZ
MYKCQQCGEQAEIQGKQDIDINYDTPFISDWVVCETCGYTIPKDTADKAILLNVCKYALPLICGERLKNDAFPPDDDLGKYLADLFEICEKKLETTINKAEQADEPERTG